VHRFVRQPVTGGRFAAVVLVVGQPRFQRVYVVQLHPHMVTRRRILGISLGATLLWIRSGIMPLCYARSASPTEQVQSHL
jgi:hypothetical protein